MSLPRWVGTLLIAVVLTAGTGSTIGTAAAEPMDGKDDDPYPAGLYLSLDGKGNDVYPHRFDTRPVGRVSIRQASPAPLDRITAPPR